MAGSQSSCTWYKLWLKPLIFGSTMVQVVIHTHTQNWSCVLSEMYVCAYMWLCVCVYPHRFSCRLNGASSWGKHVAQQLGNQDLTFTMWVLEKTEGRANYKIHCVLCMFRIQPISSHKPYIRVDISQITSYTGADRGGGAPAMGL